MSCGNRQPQPLVYAFYEMCECVLGGGLYDGRILVAGISLRQSYWQTSTSRFKSEYIPVGCSTVKRSADDLMVGWKH